MLDWIFNTEAKKDLYQRNQSACDKFREITEEYYTIKNNIQKKDNASDEELKRFTELRRELAIQKGIAEATKEEYEELTKYDGLKTAGLVVLGIGAAYGITKLFSNN